MRVKGKEGMNATFDLNDLIHKLKDSNYPENWEEKV